MRSAQNSTGDLVKKLIASILFSAPALVYAQAPLPPPPPQPPVRLGGDVVLASLVVRVDPEYPALARAARLQDILMVQVRISKEGTVTTQGVSRGHPLLHDAALQAVRQWQFKPIVLFYEPVEVVTNLPVNFSPLSDTPRLPAGNAVISGQIRHADGRPAATAFILASLAGVETPAVSVLVQADSIGVYRITNLPPGSYHVQAGTATGPTTYYPGVAGLNDATIISVAADRSTVERIDFTIP
jgi:TonB family protein